MAGALDGELEAASTQPMDSAGEPMAKLRPDDPAGALLARARVLGAMFGEHMVGAFGRFRVLDRLGAGGMGVVYEAYDPDLARGVALKLVDVSAKDRDGALAEAKALARLSHPNVVPIYDVGVERDHVYLVMELVRGKTLKAWVEGRAPGDILAVYQQAGLALAAAHRAGLVHRDFKPENAIVGADGRVRVVDFGLACEADDPARTTGERRPAAGTPRFMAPEIRTGTAITPAADQYSFCVALAEALEGRAPARRIAAVLERGRAAEPAARFPSMADLLHALARDPARTWRWIGAGGGVAVSLVAAAFVLGRHAADADACEDGAAEIDAAWSVAARGAALDRLATLGPYGQSLRPLLARGLDEHGLRWAREYRAACVDRRSGTESDTLVDRRTTCLRRSRDALATVRALVQSAEGANLVELPRAVQAIPDPAACADRDALLSDVAPPRPELSGLVAQVGRRIDEARIHLGAGRYEQAVAEAAAAGADARRLGYPPTLAEALLVQGHARTKLAGRAAAVPILAEATTLAIESRADALAIEAWARRAWAQGTGAPGGQVAALAGLEVVEPLAQRTQSAAFARALLYNNLGSVELGRTHRPEARAYFARALTAAQQVTGRGALELVAIRVNLALATDDRAQSDRLLAEAAGELADRLGADHPDALEVQQHRGLTMLDDLRAVEALLAPVCRADELHPTLADRAAACWFEVSLARWDLGDRSGAAAAMERAASASREDVDASGYLALLRGDAEGAVRRFSDAVSARPTRPGEPSWIRFARASSLLGLGRARRAAGDLRGARDALERAIADTEAIARDYPAASHDRQLGRARVELALALRAIGASAAERAAIAADAVSWLRRAGGSPDVIAQLRE